MTRTLLKKIILLSCMLFSVFPVLTVFAQDGVSELKRQEQLAERKLNREARRAEFVSNNPEAVARMQERRQEIETRRSDFEANFPDAAGEMHSWVEDDNAQRDAKREEMEARRAEFENKYPEAVAEMKAMQDRARENREARKAKIDARQSEFEEKFPDAAAELRAMREELPGGGKRMRHGGWSRSGHEHEAGIGRGGDFQPGI